MTTRRRFLTLLTSASATASLAGCTGDNGSSEDGSAGSDPVDEAPANDTVNPNNPGYDNSKPGNTSNGTTGNGTVGNSTVENGTVGNETDSGTVETPEDPDLTGEQIYFDWIHGENEEILEENKGEHGQISFNSVNNALEEGFEDGGRNQAIAQALETASQEYQENSNYEDRHGHILSALHTTLEQKEGDQWNFDIFSMKDWGKSSGFPNEGVDYSKIWVENENGEYTDINAGLSDKVEHTTHIEGEEVTSKRQEVLQMLTDPESSITRPAHDYEALQNAIEFYTETEGREYSDEDIEEINGYWIERLDNHILGEGTPIPSSVEEWIQFHEGLEKGPEVFLGLNETYHNEGYDGEPAQFTVKDKVDGTVAVEDLPDDYTIAEDGVPGNPAA